MVCQSQACVSTCALDFCHHHEKNMPLVLGGIRAPRSRATTATATEIGQAPAGGRRLSRTERAHPAAPGEQMAVALGH